MRETTRMLVVALILTVLVGGLSTAFAQTPQQVWQETLTIGGVDEPQTFDPHVNVTQIGGQRLFPNIYEGLVRYDAQGRILPMLATEWSLSRDGLIYTFTLRQNVRFSDGTPFDAAAVRLAFDRLKTINKGPVNVFAEVKTVEALGPHTVRITLTEPFAPFLSALASWQGALFMSPKTVQDNAGNDQAQRYMNDHTAGTGPFMLQSWEPERQIILVRNPHYWGPSPAAGVKRVVYRTVREPATGSQLILRGDVDILEQLVPEFVGTLSRSSALSVQTRVSLGGSYGLHVHFNSKKSPFTDVRVRQALSYAVDYRRIVDQAFGRLGKQARGPLPDEFTPWFNEKAVQYTTDLNRARALLREAGIEGRTFRVTLGWQSGNRVQRDIGQIVKDNLAPLGFDIQLQEMTLPVWREAIWKNTFEMIFVQFSLAYADPDARLWRAYHSSELRDRGFNPGWLNKQYDELLEQARREGRPEVRKRLYDEAQLVVTREAPTIFLATVLYSYAVRNAVSGLDWIPAYGPFFAAAGVRKDPAGFSAR
jgi:peptide/nickel transport system substrate-binding protein